MTLADVFEGRARWTVEVADCRFAMSCMADASVDAVVCDPPYELGFMGKRWDSTGIAFNVEVWREALRVLKPGGHLLAFGGTRTYHRLACAIEDAGFDIRDSVAWLYGSGFPKSLNVSKAIEALALTGGSSPKQLADAVALTGQGSVGDGRPWMKWDPSNGTRQGVPRHARQPPGGWQATTAEAVEAEGYGTALKPAFEPIIVARKPLDGTVAANWLKHGTGALNIDGCRIGDEARISEPMGGPANSYGGYGATATATAVVGRWPANVALTHCEGCDLLDCAPGCPVAELDAQSGSGTSKPFPENVATGAVLPFTFRSAGGYSDTGGASRFFFTAKASRAERDAGLEDFEPKTGGEATDRKDGSAGLESPRTGAGRHGGARNSHPTVKPVDLMRWLVRLVSRPGSLILDPFCGSGTTGVATMLEGEGRRFVGLELEPLHVDFARARIAHKIGGTIEREVIPERPYEKRQLSIYDRLSGHDKALP